jgi:hypothetical protein
MRRKRAGAVKPNIHWVHLGSLVVNLTPDIVLVGAFDLEFRREALEDTPNEDVTPLDQT